MVNVGKRGFMSFKRTAISLSIFGLIAFTPSFAEGENPKFERAKTTAQAATDAGEWKKAETNWLKCLACLEAQGEATPDASLELTLKRLAQANRQAGDYVDGQTYLRRAIDIANKINMADPDLQTESNELCKYCRVIDPVKLGADAEKLIRDNKATIVVVKDKDEGSYVVTVTVPNRIENTTGDDKVDSIAMEKSVTLNLTEGTDGTVQAQNIKGFKIHVVEKKMWVNLLAVNFGKPNETGQRDAAITAGKMGVTKTVTKSIDPKIFQPVAAFVDETKLFGTPTDIATTGTSPSTTTTSTTTGTGSTTTSAGTSPATGMSSTSVTTTPASTPTAATTTTSSTDLSVPASNGAATSSASSSTNASSSTPGSSTPGSSTPGSSTPSSSTPSSSTPSSSASSTGTTSSEISTSNSSTSASVSNPPADAAPKKAPEIETTTVIDFSEEKKKEEAPKVEEPKQQSSSSVTKEANGSSSSTPSVKKHQDDDDDDDDDDDRDKDKKKRDRDDD
jgi:hypothetical protein